jgi:HSP20 family protein
MMWKNSYGRSRTSRRQMMWPGLLMRKDMRGLHWDLELGGTSGPVQTNFPTMNIWEGDEGMIVTAEIPGVVPDNIDIAVQGNILTLSGSRESEELSEGMHYNRRERGNGEFSRSVKLQFQADTENVQATFRNGILQIELPRLPEEKPRKIEIKSA